jgi:hypothetical protein
VIRGELTVISSRFVESIVDSVCKGLHAGDEKSYTVTGAERIFHRYGCEEEAFSIVPSQVQSGFQGIEVKFSLTFDTRQGNLLYALSQVQSDF